jgi:hypothetical protein
MTRDRKNKRSDPFVRVWRELEQLEQDAERFPEHLRLATTWRTWSDVQRYLAAHNEVIEHLRREVEELHTKAKGHEFNGRPNMAAADRFHAILFELAMKALEEKRPWREHDDGEARSDDGPRAGPRAI